MYEGQELPWAPTAFDGVTDLVTTNFKYYTSNDFSSSKTRSYNPAFGFDRIVALYGMNSNAFTFQSDYGRPGTAVGTAIFRAGNAVTQSQVGYSFDQLGRIGLPTLDEWRKIREYGVVDSRFPFSNVPYWSSSMNGTQSGTYNPQTGAENWENRQVKHRTRLVYHKNDFAKKK